MIERVATIPLIVPNLNRSKNLKKKLKCYGLHLIHFPIKQHFEFFLKLQKLYPKLNHMENKQLLNINYILIAKFNIFFDKILIINFLILYFVYLTLKIPSSIAALSTSTGLRT